MDRESVETWLSAYVAAWKSYDSDAISALFAEDATYSYDPFSEPIEGRDAIVASWLDDRDPAGTYEARYEPVVIEGRRAVSHGRSRYWGEDGAVEREYDNIFVMSFDDQGRCEYFKEWYMRRP